MELYLLAAFVFIYAVMNFVVNKAVMRKVWLISFIVAFMLTGMSIVFMRSNHQDAMMSVNQMNWYFILYIFGYIAVALGVINLWIYRDGIYRVITAKDEKQTEKTKD